MSVKKSMASKWMVRVLWLVGLSWSVNLWADEHNVRGWSSDGSVVYDTSDDTGQAEEGGYSGQANLVVVVDAVTGQLTQYLTGLGDATPDEKKRYGALPDKHAFDSWLAAHPLTCAGGRQSADGKARADIKVVGSEFSGAWKGKHFDIAPGDNASEAFHATFNVTRDGQRWPSAPFTGRVAFYGTGQESQIFLCWSPDGKRVAFVTHSDHTMRDPEMNEVRLAAQDRPTQNPAALDPENLRTAELRAATVARRANATGMKAYHAKNYLLAAKRFRESIAADGGYVVARYNLACVMALLGDKPAAIAELKWLSASADPEAKTKLTKAASDPDLRSVADDPTVKGLLK